MTTLSMGFKAGPRALQLASEMFNRNNDDVLSPHTGRSLASSNDGRVSMVPMANPSRRSRSRKSELNSLIDDWSRALPSTGNLSEDEKRPPNPGSASPNLGKTWTYGEAKIEGRNGIRVSEKPYSQLRDDPFPREEAAARFGQTQLPSYSQQFSTSSTASEGGDLRTFSRQYPSSKNNTSSFRQAPLQPSSTISDGMRRRRGLALLKSKIREPQASLASKNHMKQNVSNTLVHRKKLSTNDNPLLVPKAPPAHRLERRRRSEDLTTQPDVPTYPRAQPSTSRSTEPARIPQHMKQATDTDGLKEYPDENEVIELYKCQMCDRKFGRDSYKKHVRICKTVFNSKRKKFDSTAHRTRGTAFAAFAKKRRRNSNSGKAVATQRAIKSIPKWKEQSRQLRAAMKAARQYASGKKSNSVIPAAAVAPTVDHSLIPCPHCGRRFSEKAHQRHVPVCLNIINRPKQLHRGMGRGAHMRVHANTNTGHNNNESWTHHKRVAAAKRRTDAKRKR